MKRTALVFDVDGTLVDTVLDLQSALNEVLVSMGLRALTPDEVRRLIGDGPRVLVERALAATGGVSEECEPAHQRFLQIYPTAPTKRTRLYSDVATTLRSLRGAGARLAICTNKSQTATLGVLNGFGISTLFDAVLGGDIVAFRKPDPRHFLAAIEELGATIPRPCTDWRDSLRRRADALPQNNRPDGVMSFVKAAAQKINHFSRTSHRCIGSWIRRSKTHILLVAALATLGACAPLAEVREVNPKLGAQHGTLPQLERAEQAIAEGQKLQHSDRDRAIGFYLSGLEATDMALRKDPRNPLALRDYDFALSRVFSVIRDVHHDPWTHPLHVTSPDDGEYVLTQRANANPRWKPQDFDLIPADELDVRGKFVVPRITRTGAGASLVAVRNEQAPEIRQRFVPPRIYCAVTALAHFSRRKCEIEFIDPLAKETIAVSGRRLPSDADFTAPIALGLSREHPEKVGVPAMLNPEKFAGQERLIQVQPYDPNKIPVLFVHGLEATPVTWVPMVNALWADPVLRRNYQVWIFGYPSGYPVPYSALLLRRQLDALDEAFPHHHPIVLVGHSMGGILCRLMISDSRGDKFWRDFFGKPPAETKISPESMALLKEALVFKPRHAVARVIFISTPHRGSLIAQGPIGRIASSMIRKPSQFTRLGPEIVQASVVQEEPGMMKLKRMPNSIDTLAPNDPFVKFMNTLPLSRGVPYHSIIGDRGRGDTPNSSDGVVPYWSSHLDGAESETIVSSGHGANQNPEAIAEVIRILKKRVGSKGSVKPSAFSNSSDATMTANR